MIKVLHIDDRFHPGIGYQTTYFAELHSPDIEFHFLSSDSFSLWHENDSEAIKNRDRDFEKKFNVKITRLPCLLSPKNRQWLWMKGLVSEVLRINPDIIYAHSLEGITATRIILSSLSKKYFIVSDTHTLLNQRNLSLTGKIFDFFLKYIYIPTINRKNIIVFYTAEENGRILRDLYGVKESNIKKCLIGTSLDDYRFDPLERNSMRKKMEIPDNVKIVLYAGKMNNRKQPHLILNAVKKIESEIDEELHLVFVGAKDPAYFAENFNVSFNNKIKIQVYDGVPNKELFKYYSMADIGIFPKENTISSLDAQACKLPLIMMDDETNKERLQKGGILYKKNDTDDLANKILLLLRDEGLRTRLKEEGSKFIKENYDFKIIVKDMENTLIQYYKIFNGKN
jgi:glycosyltransferase involved in cell wall biosynthesis